MRAVGREALRPEQLQYAATRATASKSPGPTFQHLFGADETMGTPSGSLVTIDENYIQESIQKPQAKIVMGFTSVQMPTVRG